MLLTFHKKKQYTYIFTLPYRRSALETLAKFASEQTREHAYKTQKEENLDYGMNALVAEN